MEDYYTYLEFYFDGTKVGAGYIAQLSMEKDRLNLSRKQGIERYDHVVFFNSSVLLLDEQADIINNHLKNVNRKNV